MMDEDEVARVLDLAEVIAAMERALRLFSAGDVEQPVRSVVPVVEHGAFMGVMPAYLDGVLGAKLVTVYPGNVTLPSHQAIIVLFDGTTGELLVTMDGRLITEVRTAAVSAVATRLLARPEAAVLAILGSGVQAHSHLEALRQVRDFREIRVWSPRHAETFAREHRVEAARSARDAVEGADVVVTVTSAREPVLRGEWLKPGAHINAVGACRPTERELDDEVLRRAKLYVDSRAAAQVESGDVIAAGRIVGELGEVLAGKAPGRESAEEITLFKSLGLAVEDVVTAELVYRKITAGG
jgi:alanine dehydrogenase